MSKQLHNSTSAPLVLLNNIFGYEIKILFLGHRKNLLRLLTTVRAIPSRDHHNLLLVHRHRHIKLLDVVLNY